MSISAREKALNILDDILNKGAYSNIAIKNHIDSGIDRKDEGLVREIVYGVLENEIYINYIISKASSIRMKKIHPMILIIIQMGIYQIAFMDKIPERASVNEAVNLAKKYGNKGSIGFVNGILRNISRNKEEFMKINEDDKLKYISIKYSHPEWMVRRWTNTYGIEFAEKICEKNNEKPKLNIRVNTLKTNREELKKSLQSYGLIVEDTNFSNDSLVIQNPIQITGLKEFKKGHFIIQDESSALVGQIMNPTSGATVIDCCSAPGGKSTHIAQLMENRGRILSQDIYEHKIKLVEDNGNRLGIKIIETSICDASKRNENLVGIADYLLLDAPCSGLGLIRRKPEIKRNRKEEDIEELVKLQYNILNNVKDYLKVGGTLVYSTCTIENEENKNLISRFLKENSNFKPVDIKETIGNIEGMALGSVQLFPHIHDTDGFYIAKLIKER